MKVVATTLAVHADWATTPLLLRQPWRGWLVSCAPSSWVMPQVNSLVASTALRIVLGCLLCIGRKYIFICVCTCNFSITMYTGQLSCLTFPADLVAIKAIMLSLCFYCAFCLRRKLRKVKGWKTKWGTFAFSCPSLLLLSSVALSVLFLKPPEKVFSYSPPLLVTPGLDAGLFPALPEYLHQQLRSWKAWGRVTPGNYSSPRLPWLWGTESLVSLVV